jgi:hypothetical protein
MTGIHPSMQPGFHPNAGFWILLAFVLVVIVVSAGRRKRS